MRSRLTTMKENQRINSTFELSWVRKSPSQLIPPCSGRPDMKKLSKKLSAPEVFENFADEEIVLPSRVSHLHDHNCLLLVLSFLSWEDLNTFSFASKGCYKVRAHHSLDQTRSGTITLGNGVSDAKELMDKVRTEQWSSAFCGHRTHLRLSGLAHLSSNIEPINQAFIDTIDPLKQVKSLDCSVIPKEERLRDRQWFLAPFEDYVDKGFAHGLTLSLLVPNLRSIDMTCLPVTLLGLACLAENNPNLEVIRWNRSLIWPISTDSGRHLECLKNLREVYLDDARMIFCAEVDEGTLWASLTEASSKLERVSLKRTRWYRRGQPSQFSQENLMKFVRASPNLKWFRSDLTSENIEKLRIERPSVIFC